MPVYEVSGHTQETMTKAIVCDSPHHAAKMFREENEGFSVDSVEPDHGDPLFSVGRCEACQREVFENEEYGIWSEDNIVICPECLQAEMKESRKKRDLCPYPSHAADCTCRGMGGDR